MTPKHFPITRAQRLALFRVFQRDFPSWTTPYWRIASNGSGGARLVRVPTVQWRRFRQRVQPAFDRSGAIMILWQGMWIGIERDGYTHS